MIVDFDLATLDAADLRAADLAARALRRFAETRAEPALLRVVVGIVESLAAEQRGRDAGRGRGTARLAIPDFTDAAPADAARARRSAIAFLVLPRDDPDERPAVRRLFAAVAADLADPTPTSVEHERARLDELWS